MSTPRVSVIIPTLGRDALHAAIASARAQSEPVRIIVVNDSGGQLTGLSGVGDDLTVLDTTGREGAAAARNAGMAVAQTEFLAFLDDDDTWLPGHLADALRVLDSDPDCDIYSGRGLVLSDGRSRIEPVDPLAGRSVRSYFYGRDPWRSRNRRIMTPTLVFRRALTGHLMDPKLTNREDSWWLLTAEHAGHRVVMSPHVGLVVNADHAREIDRTVAQDEISWAHRVESLYRGAGASHLAGCGRTAARAGQPAQVVRLAREAARFPQGRSWLPAFAVELLVAAVLGVRRRISRG